MSKAKIDITHFQSLGYNKNQATSLAWADFFAEKQAIIEYKYQGNFDAGFKFDCYCYDCKKGNVFGAAETIKLFIDEHYNHKTKTRKI
jgi:hypothetical protein